MEATKPPAPKSGSLEGPKAPWWAEDPQEPDPDGPAAPSAPVGETDPNEADGEDAMRTAHVVQPSPGTLVAGPGVPKVDTRGAIPPAPLVDIPQPQYLATTPDGFSLAEAAEAAEAVEATDDDRPDVTRPEGLTPPAVSEGTTETVTDAAVPPWGAHAGAPEPPPGQPADSGPVGVSFDVLGSQGPVTVTLPTAAAPAQEPAPWPAMNPVPQPLSGGPQPPRAGFGAGPEPGVLASAYQPPAWPDTPENPGGTEGTGPSAATAGGGGNRRLLLIVGGVAGAVLITAIAFLGVSTLSGGSPAKKKTAAAHSAPPGPQPSTTPSANGGKPPGTTPPGPKGPNIDNEKTDPQALSLVEVFPSAKLSLGGRDYQQDKTSVNHRCALAARGGMAKALDQGHCSSIVRATYVDGTKKYAVTAGIAVLPTKAAALTASKAGDPSRYEWFRGMQGKLASKIDQAGGFAASTVRGRYIVYAYAQYADGTKPQPDDATLKALSHQFIGYALRPIIKRAQ